MSVPHTHTAQGAKAQRRVRSWRDSYVTLEPYKYEFDFKNSSRYCTIYGGYVMLYTVALSVWVGRRSVSAICIYVWMYMWIIYVCVDYICECGLYMCVWIYMVDVYMHAFASFQKLVAGV